MAKIQNNKIAIIFDMDGLMVNTESLYLQANAEMAKKRGKKFSIQISKNMMGRKAKDSISALKKGLGLKESVASLEKEREIIYKKLIQKKLSPMPGLFKLLKLLKRNNYTIAISSSSHKKWINYVLKRLNLRKYFKLIVSGDNIKKGKPHPEIFLKTAKLLKINPKFCLVLEDTQIGVEAAKKAGMKCVAVPNKIARQIQNFKKADLVLKSLNQINLTIVHSLF